MMNIQEIIKIAIEMQVCALYCLAVHWVWGKIGKKK